VPTVLRISGLRFYFYSHEPNEPAHIHVDKGDATIKIWLETIQVAKSRGFRSHEINDIVKIVAGYRSLLLEKWHEYFG
jgi:coproporphyrinogen III oxidase-like Fe-S oxidoreductase